MQATSEMIQYNTTLQNKQKQNRDRYREPVTTKTKAYKLTSILSHATLPFTFFMLVTSPRNNVEISHQARH